MSTSITTYQHYIDGAFVESPSHFDVNNPATGALLSRAPQGNADHVDRAISAARKAQGPWGRKTATERAGHLRRISAALRENVASLADVIVREQGKIRSLAEVEVNFTADYIDYMAEWGRRIEGEIIPSDRPNESIFLFRKPMGVVAGILPWNFPFFLIARKMAPALITGNTIVIKPSEETPNNCFEFAKIVAQTDLPAGVFNVVGGKGDIGGQLSAHAGIDMISFTGSVATGQRIMAASAKNLTKLNLELGGKAPAIVLADADLDLAVNAIRGSRIINTGQVCNCAERVYVERRVADAFISKITAAMKATRYGDPGTDASVEMGPLINQAGLDKVLAKVNGAREQGGSILTGGKVADLGQGFHFEPTVIVDCREDMAIMREEIFGPVLPIQIVDDLDHAIALANDSDYGLTSSVYTMNVAKAMHAVRGLDFGETYVNRENFEAMQGFHAGVRKSGVGGADGKHGMLEYTHTQVVYLQT